MSKAGSVSAAADRRTDRVGARWAALFAVVLAVVVACLSLVSGASAATVQTHPYIGSFSPPPIATPKGPFRPISLAINQATGNVYVVDAENDVVDVFGPSGTFLNVLDGSDTPDGHFTFSECCGTSFSAIAIDNSGGPSQGRIYLGSRGIVTLSPSGSYLFSSHILRESARRTGQSLAVDNHGSLVVGFDTDSAVGPNFAEWRLGIYKKPQSDVPTVEIEVEPFSGIDLGDVDVDSQDNLYAVGYPPARLAAVNADGSLRWTAAASGGVTALSVDRSANQVYALEGIGDPDTSYVSRYDTDGNLEESFGVSIVSQGGRGIAVAESNGKVYVADGGKGAIEVFGPQAAATAPDVTAEGATAITETSATLNGMINPQGVSASSRFQYRREKTRQWTSTALQAGGSGVTDEAVSTAVSDLRQNTTYEVRLQALNRDNGAVFTSGVTTFTTPGQAQAILTINPASSLIPTGAQLSGTVDPNGSDAKWHFEYTTDDSFQENWSKVGSDQTVGGGSGATPVSAELNGLRPNTHYFGRLVATNETGGPKESSEVEFTTPPAPPVVLPLAAGCLTPASACLGGYVDPKNSATTFYFEYGTDSSYGTAVPAGYDGDAGAAFGTGRVGEQISGLQPGTTYHFRLVAHNAAGTTFGEDTLFQTRPDASQKAEMEAAWPARGFELVNTPDKGNQAVFPPLKDNPSASISPDGTRVMWVTPNGGPQSSGGAFSAFISEYTPAGWTSRSLLPPASQLPDAGDSSFKLLSFNSDFSNVALLSEKGSPFFARFRFSLIGVDDAQHATVLERFPSLANWDLLADSTQAAGAGRVVLGGPHPLTVYQADGSEEPVPIPNCGYQQVTLAESPTTDPTAPTSSTAPAIALYEGVKTWVNADASRLFVYSAGDADCDEPRGIFMLEPATGAITRVSGPQTANAEFLRANPDGSELLFTKGGDLYRWRLGAGDECLTCGSGDTILFGATPSRDLSHVYFCGPVPAGSPPGAECAIYVWREGGIDFVGETSEVTRFTALTNLEISANGEQVIFKTTRPYIASADPTGWNGGDYLTGGMRGTQLYHYDDTTGILDCLSCTNPPNGGVAAPEFLLASNRPVISADGKTVAFATNAKLLPEDINGRFDLYEWHDGLFRLVTDGESEFEDSLTAIPRPWGFSADGRSLFFSVGGVALTGNELDTVANVYDARIGSAGFPPSQPPAHCVEDSCQGPLAAPPTTPATASSSFSGPGNATQAKKKKARKHRRHHKHHKRHQHHQHRKASAGADHKHRGQK